MHKVHLFSTTTSALPQSTPALLVMEYIGTRTVELHLNKKVKLQLKKNYIDKIYINFFKQCMENDNSLFLINLIAECINFVLRMTAQKHILHVSLNSN